MHSGISVGLRPLSYILGQHNTSLKQKIDK